jgi:plasmid stabilization system protein ParE
MADLKNIQFFIAHDSDYQAENFVKTLFREAQKIAKSPEGGTIC